MHLPATTLASNAVARSSIARTSTSVTPRCSMRNSACPVNDRSPFHHSGKVGTEAFVGPSDRAASKRSSKPLRVRQLCLVSGEPVMSNFPSLADAFVAKINGQPRERNASRAYRSSCGRRHRMALPTFSKAGRIGES